MNVRCVVTGQTDGKSVIVQDTSVEPITLALLPGYEFFRFRGSDGVPALPENGRSPVPHDYFPGGSGFRFGFFTVPPADRQRLEQIDMPAALAELQQKLPGLAAVMEPDHPGMHTTDTIDFDVIVSGEVFMEVDGGTEVLLKAGDCVVQNGTRHRWTNRSGQPCVIAVCLIGANRLQHEGNE